MQRGVRPIVTRRGARDAMDASYLRAILCTDEGCACGRQRRVGLAPQRQVASFGFDDALGDGDTKAGLTGASTQEPVNTIAQGMSDDFGVTVVTNSCVFYLCTRGCGCSQTPGIPCALSCFEGHGYRNDSDAIAPRECEGLSIG